MDAAAEEGALECVVSVHTATAETGDLVVMPYTYAVVPENLGATYETDFDPQVLAPLTQTTVGQEFHGATPIGSTGYYLYFKVIGAGSTTLNSPAGITPVPFERLQSICQS